MSWCFGFAAAGWVCVFRCLRVWVGGWLAAWLMDCVWFGLLRLGLLWVVQLVCVFVRWFRVVMHFFVRFGFLGVDALAVWCVYCCLVCGLLALVVVRFVVR